jgi:SAM-dependent methyltransferase
MPKIDSEQFYTSAIKMHGTSARGVNWASKENQELRFDALCKLLPNKLSNISLADAGCGFGDLYLYLEKKKNTPKKYIGIDSLVDMYSIASENTAQEILIADICKEELPVVDFYVCSGALNVLTPFETLLFVQNCFKSAKKGFVFNALLGEKQSQTYNYLTKEKILQMAKELKVQEVLFKEGYLEDDISVGFLK